MGVFEVELILFMCSWEIESLFLSVVVDGVWLSGLDIEELLLGFFIVGFTGSGLCELSLGELGGLEELSKAVTTVFFRHDVFGSDCVAVLATAEYASAGTVVACLENINFASAMLHLLIVFIFNISFACM